MYKHNIKIIFCVLMVFYVKMKGQEFTEFIQKPKKNIIKKNKYFKPIADTVQLDTLVLTYKKKDTAIIIKKFKGKIPVLISSINGLKSGDNPDVEMMKIILDSPIIIKDDKGNNYKVISYRFCYKKKDIYLDDEKMNVKTRFDLFTLQLSETPLPERYKKSIINELKKDEQFWFENIIVENNKGEKFLSKDITLIIN